MLRCDDGSHGGVSGYVDRAVSRMSELHADLERLRPLAEACAQQPDTDATRKALCALRDAAVRAGESLNIAEEQERLALINAANRRLYA